LPAIRSAALDCQERLGDIVPAGIPLDTAADDRVLGLEHQGILVSRL